MRVCVRVFSVGFGPRSRRSASHAAGTHGWLPQKTGRPGLRRGGVGGYNLHSVPPTGTPTTSRLYPFGAISSCHAHLCQSQVLPYPLLHSLIMSVLVFQPVFFLQVYTPYICSPSPLHMSIPSQPTTSNSSCYRLNSNQLSQCFTCPSVFHGNTKHPSNHLHLCSFKL